jgi:spore germination cell wall hydrolase CwlJ-like protein
VRIRRLLLALALALLGSATPLHASLGVVPQCLPLAAQGATETADAKPPIPELRQVVPNYTAEDRDYLIRTIAFEAPDESDEGKAAVGHVILNRAKSGRWGDSIKDVVTHPWQFEPWMTRRKEMEKLSPDDPRYQNAAQIADAVLSGQMPDPTAGATHFLNPTVVRQRRGGSLPSWARGEGQPIGRHTFYPPDEGGVALERTILSTGALGDSLSCSRLEAGEVPYVG